MPVNEQLVGQLAARLGLPASEVSLIQITPDVAGWDFGGGQLQVGIAHASLEQDDVVEVNSLTHPNSDDNSRRYAGLHALYDLCWGSTDFQWLEKKTPDYTVFSHDHGHYFPNGPNWTQASLSANDGVPHPAPWRVLGLSRDAAHAYAAAIEALTADDLGNIIESLPSVWPVDDDELAWVAWFLDRRRPGVAARLRALVP